MNTFPVGDSAVIQALKLISKDDVFAYFLELARTWKRENLVRNIEYILYGYHPMEDLRLKVELSSLIEATIEAARKFQEEKPRHFDCGTQTMLQVSAELLHKQIKKQVHSRLSEMVAVKYCVQIYGLLIINDNNRGSAQSMLRDCGRLLERKDLKMVLGKIDALVADMEKRQEARNLLAEGYIGRNGAYMALQALWGDRHLSQVTCSMSPDQIAKTLEKALLAQGDDPASIERSRAIFRQFAEWHGFDMARKVVEEVRPDLVGNFTNDTGKVLGKKAEL